MKPFIKLSIIVFLLGIIFLSCKKDLFELNQPPVANAGPDQTIILPIDSITLDGRSSIDPDGKISVWLWTKISGPVYFSIIHASDSVTVVKRLAKGTYHFELKITDNSGLSSKDTIRVIVDSPISTNHPPIANAGTDQTIFFPASAANLDGSGSTDPDNNISSYSWSKISGPSSVNIVIPNVVQTRVINLVKGVYQFELKVTDQDGLSASDTMQIIVNEEGKNPSANAGPDQTITLPLDSTFLDGGSSNPNGWTVPIGNTFVWTKISGPSQFILGPGAGPFQSILSKTTASLKNLVPGIYLFSFQVTNSVGVSDADTVQINVVIDPPNSNTITFHSLIWQRGDLYGMGYDDIFLNASSNPDIFNRSIEVYLDLDVSSLWVPVTRTNNLYIYDVEVPLLWILCSNPNCKLLVGQRSSIKIKLL
ncbi:MAG: hypothetical protein ABIR66_11010 [Saprospiraceae bacterium]